MNAANDRPSNRRPVIGIMTGSFHTDYSRLISEAICRRLQEDEVDIHLFQGFDASRFLDINGYVDKGFDSHYYSQFEYSRFIRPDLIIASVGTISAVSNPLSAVEFRAILPDVPVIALEIQCEIPNGIHIMLDNYRGMCDCIEHLITVHGYRKVLFVSGPKGVADAEQRLKAYRDTMQRHGLEVTGDMYCYGNFTDHVEPLIERLLSAHPHPDAIVCANDEMAESAYRVLRAHGLRPGTDVAVTGFDDNPAAGRMNPPLTSVMQSQEAIADKVVEVVRAYLRGERPESIDLPAGLVVRESCGCAMESAADTDQGDVWEPSQAMQDRDVIKRLSHESILTSLMLRNLLDEHVTVHSFFNRLGRVLRMLGAEYSWIALLDEPLITAEDSRTRLPERLRLHMRQCGGDVESWSRRDAPVMTADDPDLIGSLRTGFAPGRYTAVFPLFYGNTHYGLFTVKLSLDEMLLFYTVSLQIGTSLRYLYMALNEQEARAALEEKNQILDFSASHDSLTGLYNRVGVMNQIYSYLRKYGQGERYVAVMADLDHLKQINDSFGHSMGDHSIRKAAEIMRGALPSDAPLGRSGGDEFMAIFHAEGDGSAERFVEGVKSACRAYNAQGETPFYVEISIGCHLFEFEKSTDVPGYFREADKRLYEDKKGRRASVVK